MKTVIRQKGQIPQNREEKTDWWDSKHKEWKEGRGKKGKGVARVQKGTKP